MPMRWHNVSVPFAAGLDTKSDSKTLEPGKLADLVNGVFTKRGSIIKRAGTVRLSRRSDLTDKAGNARVISSARGVHASRNQLLLAEESSLLSWNPETERWKELGPFKSMEVDRRTVADIDTEQTAVDCCTGGGHVVTAWEDSRGGVYCQVREESTGTVVVHDRLIDASGEKPKCVYLDGSWHVVYINGTTMNSYRILAPSFAGSTIQIVSNVNGSAPVIDADLYTDGSGGDRAIVAYYTNAANEVGLVKIDRNGAVLSNTLNITGTAITAISITYELNTDCFGLFYASNTGSGVLYGSILNPQLLEEHGPIALDSTGGTLKNIASKFHRDPGVGENTHSVLLERAGSEAVSGVSAAGSALDLRRDWTIEAHVRPVTLPSGSSHTVFSKDNGTTGFRFWYSESGGTHYLNASVRAADGSASTAQVSWTPSTATWYHLAVVRDQLAGTIKFYVDGDQQGSTVTGITTDESISSANDFQIGRAVNPGASDHIDAYVDDVRVWNVARVEGAISGGRLVEIAADTPGLVANWRLNNSYADATASNQNGGAVNFPSFHDSVVPFTTYSGTATASNEYFAEVFYEKNSVVASWRQLVRRVRLSVLGNVSDPEDFMLHAGLASRAFLRGNDVCVHLCHDDDGIQRTMFAVTDERTIISKMFYGTHGGLIGDATLPGVQELGGGRYRGCSVFRKRLATIPRTIGSDGESSTDPPQDNELYSGRGIKEYEIKFEGAQADSMVQAGPSAYLGGGFIWQADGGAPVESGFHLFPANVTAVAANNAKEIPDEGAYFYKVYYEWTNLNGERERSAFGAPVRVDLATGEDEVTLTIPTLSFTGKRDTRRNVSIVVYRSGKDPVATDPFFRVSSPDPTATGDNGYLANDPTVDTVTFVDGYRNLASDTGSGPVLVEQELDYKADAELDNIPPPACSVLTEGKDRIFMAGFEDPNEVQYSKQRFAGSPVEFNDALKFSVPEDGGRITALAELNSRLIVFKRGRIYGVTGSGPNNLGGGQGFSRPALITTSVGCVDQRTVVMTPMGLMFQSVKGIYLLTQQLQVTYIGADVEAYNSQTFASAELKADDDQVIFLAESGRSLAFNYLFQQWSTFTGYSGVAGTVWDDTFVFVDASGRVSQESSSVWTDAGVPYKLQIETSWIKLRGLAGFMRCRRAMVTGEYRSPHRLTVGVSYDYEDDRRDYTFDPTVGNVGTTNLGDPVGGDLGDGNPLGSGTVAPEMESGVYQFRLHLPRQKCQAVKFRFSDRPAANGTQSEQAFELSELMLQVGGKNGMFKPSDAKTVR
jgi:hypothetical protein